MKSRIPEETIRRLPHYLRVMNTCSEHGYEFISSQQLGDLLHVKSSLIRKDLSLFGEFGKHGIGYDLLSLIACVKKILHLDIVRKAALVGTGKLGYALLKYTGFKTYGIQIVAAFDVDEDKIGNTVGSIRVKHVSHLKDIINHGIDLGIISVPEEAAQEVADLLIESGIHGILNFSSRNLTILEPVKVITIDIAMELVRLPYYMSSKR